MPGEYILEVIGVGDNVIGGVGSSNKTWSIEEFLSQGETRIVNFTIPGEDGDIDGDGDVDLEDLNILLADRNTSVEESSCGVPCDLDGDGVITALDARQLTLLCTRPRCATQ